MIERSLLEYSEFRKYLETGKAVAVDFVIRDSKGRTLLTYREEPPKGYHFPGGIVLPGENPEEIVVWVAKKELDWDILSELNLQAEDLKGSIVGEVSESFNDEIRDPRGPIKHRTYLFSISDTSVLLTKKYENGGGFFENPNREIIPQHKRIMVELKI